MGYRTAALMLLAGATAGLAGACAPEDVSIAAGDPLHSVLERDRHTTGGPAPPATIIWAVTTEDCLSCLTFPTHLRHLRHRYRDRVEIVVVHVGHAPDTAYVKALLKRERIPATVMSLTNREFRDAFGSPTLPRWYLAANDRFAAVQPPPNDQPEEAPLFEALARLLEP